MKPQRNSWWCGTGVGTINDDDAAPTIGSVTSPTVAENSLVYTVNMTTHQVLQRPSSYTLGGGTAAAGDYGTLTFSNGVTLSAGVLTVPAGVTGFTVTLPTVDDTTIESSETVPLTVGRRHGNRHYYR